MAINQNVNLFDIVSYVETKNNPHLIRFEPTVYANISRTQTPAQVAILQNIQKIHLCSFGTAQMIYSTSWGATQIMGFNLYGNLACQSPVWTLGDNQVSQVAMFEKFCTLHKIDYPVSDLVSDPEKKRQFALTYNGNAVAYSAMIDQALAHYGVA